MLHLIKKFLLIEVASVAYVNGKLFYMKYLLIFGIPSWFALADGMRPPQGPICISRISKYSRMWRTFDSGLYQFLKNQVRNFPIVSLVIKLVENKCDWLTWFFVYSN